MKKRIKTRFVIDVDGSLRTVFSVRETRTGDLNIHVTGGGRTYTAPTLSNLVKPIDEAMFEKCHKHISVHASPKSNDLNLIKQSLEFAGREDEHLYQFTTGMKKDDLFVPVLFRVCGDLRRDRYLVHEDCPDELISLGGYHPGKDQIRFMAVCCLTSAPMGPNCSIC